MGRAIGTVILTALLAASATAQDASKMKQDLVGQWELATAERSKTCVVTLASAP
ncbi:peptidase, partial [Rhodopseudomonas sp. WA056]|nr:peptidase [Rhodopseudomonas sp. WA056]